MTNKLLRLGGNVFPEQGMCEVGVIEALLIYSSRVTCLNLGYAKLQCHESHPQSTPASFPVFLGSTS